MNLKDTTIIGAGPAGIAAAIQLRRYGLDIALFEKDSIGGLLCNANLIENYPGFPGGITGREMVRQFEKSLAVFVDDVIFEEVGLLDYRQDYFIAESDTRQVRSRAAIIATGTRPLTFGDIDFSEDVRKRVFYEIAPLLEERNKTIAIVGAGDAAFDYALNLTRPGLSNRVRIVNRSDRVKALPLLQERVKRQTAIDYVPDSLLKTITMDDQGRLSVEYDRAGSVATLHVDFLVFAVGREPELSLLSDGLQKKMSELQQKGLLHLAGDVKNDIFRQSAISVGQGVMAAMEIYRQVKDHTKD